MVWDGKEWRNGGRERYKIREENLSKEYENLTLKGNKTNSDKELHK